MLVSRAPRAFSFIEYLYGRSAPAAAPAATSKPGAKGAAPLALEQKSEKSEEPLLPPLDWAECLNVSAATLPLFLV